MSNGKNPFIVLNASSLTQGLTQISQMLGEKHVMNPSEDCMVSINYTLQHVLMVMIQKITGHKTHDIFTNISSCIDEMQKDFSMDFNKKTLCREWSGVEWTYSYKIPKLTKKLVTYPGTDIQFFISIKTQYHGDNNRWGNNMIHGKYLDDKEIKENCNYIEVSVYVPQKKITFNQENMEQVLMEGSLLDMSDDIEEVELKDSTPKQKKKTTTDSKSKKKKGRK